LGKELRRGFVKFKSKYILQNTSGGVLIGDNIEDVKTMSNHERIERIISYFKFSNIDDATEGLCKVLAHSRQEGRDFAKEYIPIENLVEEIIQRTKKPEYERIESNCRHFAYLLKEIGEHFGHECEIVQTNPLYLPGTNHYVVFDRTEKKYKDASIYKNVFNGRMWGVSAKDANIKMTDVPEKLLNVKGMVDKFV
jgi:hypothetical protein